MQVTIGTSINSNVQAAVAEVVAKADKPNLLVLLSSYEQLKEASEIIAGNSQGFHLSEQAQLHTMNQNHQIKEWC